MSDNDFDLNEPDEDDEQDAGSSQREPGWRKRLEREARQGREAQAAALAAQKELAFYKAGLPMDDPKLAYFVKGYDGEIDPDAIRRAAAEAGFIQANAQDTAQADEVAQSRQIAEASAGASAPGGRKSQAEILAEAQKAASQARPGNESAAFAAVLSTYGITSMAQAPAQ